MAVKGVIILHYLEESYLGLENERRYKGEVNRGRYWGLNYSIYNVCILSTFQSDNWKKTCGKISFL